ncbi:hypothetical protein VOLCADRAFT_104365 [Volvox carteri f. nagariensis]|uniref:Uncharacterized protein n=1 Tax=Volvox carteri f. nagariensis TaxID=3068 RepID=D8TT92_VOLCA|nr:uncharacterized protein VOLCADRAFT_104365 [Volvox carteri f. nagariensis]EFJ49267.1 hypothetical protein VOLCADRAFT_104365 [Volvox carteri f. nagariensis]|eukprot:XP_002949715.1 hypothetical protein VOLCADRAFT_104365 [Volvox carteri f. nagariensis]
MTALLSANTASDSFLYSFTPAAVGRGGQLTGSRRLRAYSVPGEPILPIPEGGEGHSDLQGIALSTSLSVPAMPVGRAAALGMSRCGSADRSQQQQHHHGTSSSLSSAAALSVNNLAGGGAAAAMPVIGGGGGTSSERILPPMRHSISGNPGIGLPKLDLPFLAFGGGGGTGGGGGGVPLERPVLGLSSSGRRSLSGTLCEVQSVSAPASFLDLPSPPPPTAAGPFEGSAPPSPPRSGAPAVLAPLRVSGVFAASGAGGCAAAAAPSFSSGPAAVGESSGGGWCGGGGGGGLLSSSSSRRHTSSAGLSEGGSFPPQPPPQGSLLPCTSEGAVASPLTPGLPYGSPYGPPRRSHSLTGSGGGSRLLADSDGGSAGGKRISDAREGPSEGANRACGSSDGGGGGGSGDATVNSSAAKALNDITADLQRSTGALLALRAPAFRSRSSPPPSAGAAKAAASAEASVAAGPPAAATVPPLSRTTLTALKESAPELQWALRVSVRRFFHMLRQELSSAVPAGRQQLGSTIHEAWATLDAYYESTAELVEALVENALDVTAAQAPPPPPPRTSANPDRQQRQVDAAGNGVIIETERAAEKLRAANEELRKQLEECRARLAESETRLTAAAARGAQPGGGGGAAAAPRPPPATTVTPPLESCYGTSPRRGKHAVVQPSRDGVAPTASDGTDGATGRTPGGGRGAAAVASPAPASPAAAATASRPPPATNACERPLRRFERSAVLARGATCDVMVIEEDDSDGDDDADTAEGSVDARRHMLTYHSASFAEWVRGARRRLPEVPERFLLEMAKIKKTPTCPTSWFGIVCSPDSVKLV